MRTIHYSNLVAQIHLTKSILSSTEFPLLSVTFGETIKYADSDLTANSYIKLHLEKKRKISRKNFARNATSRRTRKTGSAREVQLDVPTAAYIVLFCV